MKRILSLWLLSLGLLVALFAPAQEKCEGLFFNESQAAEAFYQKLRKEDKTTLNLRSGEEKDMLLNHLRKVAHDRPILIFTDASFQQTSGVVVMMKVLKEIESRFGIKVRLVVPEDFKRVIKTQYQDLIFALPTEQEINTIIEKENPFAIHVMVEGSLGRKVRGVLMERRLPFTSAYHTDFPKIVSSTINVPVIRDVLRKVTYRILKGFHRPSKGVMVPTKTMKEELEKNGFDDVELRNWSHGVDIVKFDPKFRDETLFKDLPRPISLFVGRVAPEKNIEAFLAMKTPGTKVVIGDGPSRAALTQKYPDVVFMGRMPHEELPKYFASADLFVFTSLADTFGLVMLEAAASGTPVLAFNYQGPKDAVASPKASVLVEVSKDAQQSVKNLEEGFNRAVSLDRGGVREYAEQHSWETSLIEFLYFLNPLETPLR